MINRFISVACASFWFAACAPAPIGATLTALPLDSRGLSAESEPTLTADVLISELAAIKTYEDPHFGYAFDYPLDWTITALEDIPGATVTIHSWAPGELTGDHQQSEGIPEGGEKLDITPLPSFGLDYAAAAPWFREQKFKSGI